MGENDINNKKLKNNVEIDSNEKYSNKIILMMKSIIPTVIISLFSFILVVLLHYVGAFNSLELKLYDMRLKLRGPISGLDSKSAEADAEGIEHHVSDKTLKKMEKFNKKN